MCWSRVDCYRRLMYWSPRKVKTHVCAQGETSRSAKNFSALQYACIFGGSCLFLGFNPLNIELNHICHLLALLGAHHIFHVSGLRVNVAIKKYVPHEQEYTLFVWQMGPSVESQAGIRVCIVSWILTKFPIGRRSTEYPSKKQPCPSW